MHMNNILLRLTSPRLSPRQKTMCCMAASAFCEISENEMLMGNFLWVATGLMFF